MKKIVSSSVILFMATASAFAGGLVTNTNQSAAFIRNPARDASVEVEAAYNNPAGISFMNNGVHFGFNNQSAFQQRNVTGTLNVPYGFSSTMQNQEYKGKIVSPVIPSIDFAYVADRWSISSHFGVPGGGGACEYEDGLPMFDAMIRGSIFSTVLNNNVANLETANGAATYASVASSFTGKSYLFGWQVNGSYKINDNLSVALGARLSYYKANYEGQVSYTIPGMSETVYRLNCDQSGWGISPIVGVDYNNGKFNAAIKYEFGTCIDVKNKTKEFPAAFANVPALGKFQDGVKSHADQPALLTLGASYEVLPSLTLSAGYHYFFDKDANYNGLEKDVDHNTVEYLLGAEYKINDKWLVSLGGQRSCYNVSDDYNSNTGFIMSSYSLCGGFKYYINEHVGIDLGCMWTNYDDFEKTSVYGGAIPVKEEYLRTNLVPAIGVTWDL